MSSGMAVLGLVGQARSGGVWLGAMRRGEVRQARFGKLGQGRVRYVEAGVEEGRLDNGLQMEAGAFSR